MPARYSVICRDVAGHEHTVRCETLQFNVTGNALFGEACKDDDNGGRDFDVLLTCPIMIVKDNEAANKK